MKNSNEAPPYPSPGGGNTSTLNNMMDVKVQYNTASPDWYDILKANAKKNRQNMTEAETVLWQCLRARALGVQFRRQHPVLDYIADFVCLPKKLIVEVDGGYHLTQEQTELDGIREERLRTMGYHILRFTNEEVLYETSSVLDRIKCELKQI